MAGLIRGRTGTCNRPRWGALWRGTGDALDCRASLVGIRIAAQGPLTPYFYDVGFGLDDAVGEELPWPPAQKNRACLGWGALLGRCLQLLLEFLEPLAGESRGPVVADRQFQALAVPTGRLGEVA
jgi:hypothetical protein